jgi:hypothetical protein
VRSRANNEGDGLFELVRETADGLGRLIADHIKLARVEIVADARAYGRRVALLAVAAAFLVVGYLFAWIAAALGLALLIGEPLAFLAVAVAHLVGGAIGLGVVARKLRRARVMDGTVSEVERSISTLRDQVAGNGVAAAATEPATPTVGNR